MTEQPRNRTQITDETGKTVAANVRRLREARGLSTYDLSRALAEAGRPIAPSAIAKVERAERRVDVGDLMALAVVLGVSPVTLLLPANARGGRTPTASRRRRGQRSREPVKSAWSAPGAGRGARTRYSPVTLTWARKRPIAA